MRYLCRLIGRIGLFIVVLIVDLELRAEDYKSDSEMTSIYRGHGPRVHENLPVKVRTLVKFYDKKPLPGSLRGDESAWVKRAKVSSINWIQKVIDQNWLPDDPDDLEGALQMWKARDVDGLSLDVTRVEWVKGEYRVTVLQTKTVLIVTIRRQSAESPKVAPAIGPKDVEKLAEQLIRDLPEVKADTSQGNVNIVSGGTKNVMMNKSFKGQAKQVEDGLVGIPEAIDNQDENDRVARMYWWRLCGWWSLGDQMGFYTLKTEGGGWRPNYGEVMDETWFDGPPATQAK